MPPSMMHRLWLYYLVPAVLCAATALAQDTASPAVVRGVVWDSIAAAPLARATVQLLGDGPPMVTRSTQSDASGRFDFHVPAGRYTIAFLHPALDSLGLEPTLLAVEARAGAPTEVALSIPSPRHIRSVLCGPAGVDRGVLIGFVRNARDGAPLPRVPVFATWLEYTLAKREVSGYAAAAVDTTRENGWFALCNLPARGRVGLFPTRGDGAQHIEVELPVSGFVQRDVFVDATGAGPRYRLSGRVIAAATGLPLRDGEVTVAGVPTTRTNVDGTWALDAPAGTRMLDIRAIGYYPLHRAVDVIPDAPALQVQLLTMRAMLDTIHVTATRLARNMQEFEQRRRAMGSGQFFTHDDIRRMHPVVTTDVFKMARGMEVLAGNGSPSNIYLSGVFNKPDSADRCRPDLWVDGVFLDTLMTADLADMLTRPEDVAGIEIYRAPFVPPQYSRTLGSCGSIIIWTMPPALTNRRASRKQRLIQAAAVIGGGALVGIMVQKARR